MNDKQKGASKVVIPLVRPYPILVLATLMFLGCAAFFFYRASTNDRGLIINGLIHLDLDQADVFYAVLGALAAGMSAMGAISIYHCVRIKEFRLLIGKKTLKMPPTLWRGSGDVTIALDRIGAIVMQPPEKPVVIAIHEEDRVHRIQTRWLPPSWPVHEVTELIIQRMRRARETEPPTVPREDAGRARSPGAGRAEEDGAE